MASIIIINAFAIIQRTILVKKVDFKTQTKVGLIAVIISGAVGIVCAYSGLEVWALVLQSLISQFVLSFALMYFSRWIPKLRFSVHSFKRLFSFGSKLMLSNILTSIYFNVINLVIGKKYTSADLAFYNRGFNLSLFPASILSDALNRVIFPVLTQVQDDLNTLRREYLKYLHLTHYIILPLMGLLLVLAEPLIEILLTPKWLGAVPYLQIFCLNFMLYPIQQQAGNPVAALGHSGILLKAQLLKRIVTFGILIFTLTISIPAVCWGILSSSIFEALVNVLICRKEIGVGIRAHLRSLADVVLTVAVICLAVYFLTSFISNAFMQLFVGGTLGVVLYLLATWVFNFREKEYLANAFIFVESKCGIKI